MRGPTTYVSSADLLRALQLARQDLAAADRLAASLGFHPKTTNEVSSSSDILIAPHDSGAKQPALQEPPPIQDAGKAALRCRFLTVTACETLEEGLHSVRPPVAEKPLSKADCRAVNTGNPPMSLLVSKQKLWPAVKRSLMVKRSNGVDMTRLTANIARAEPVHRLPTQWRQWWGGELQVIWDRSERMTPYFKDYQVLLTQVLDGRGRAGLTLYTVDSWPGQVTGCWPPQATYGGLAIQPVAEGTKVLILSDLGALSASPSAARHWQNFARGVRQAGGGLVAWVPHSARQVETATAQLFQIHCLDRQGNLRPQLGRLQTARQRQAEHQRLYQLREQLLVRLAFCVRLEQELLRAGRELHSSTAAEPALEGLTWSYRPIVRESDISRPLAPAYQATYRARFSTLTAEEQQAALDCVLRVHAWQGRSTGVLETLIWESHVDLAADDETARQQVAKANAWIGAFHVTQQAEAGNREIKEFAQDILSRNWQDDIFQRRHSHWLADLWALSGRIDVPAGLESADIARVSATIGELRIYRLVQIGIRLMLWPVERPAPALAASALNSPWSLVGLEMITESPYSRRWLEPAGEPSQLLELADRQTCVLISGGKRYTLSHLHRPAWASKFGRDHLGIFAECRLTTTNATASQRFRWIEPGSFWMGSPDDAPEHGGDEGPQHPVTISRGFWLADTACTQALWQALMDNNPSHFKDDPNQPVESVSWHDVQAFLQRLQKLLPGCQVDLPSEAEWEYACRAGTDTPFSFGANISPQQVNYHGDFPYAGGEKGEYREKTLPVKSLPANPWGLYEMHGNVCEWCKDGKRSYTEQAQTDPLGPVGDEEPRVFRGGSWSYDAGRARSAFRIAFRPGFAYDDLGFRFCLRSIQPGQEGVGPAGSPNAIQKGDKPSKPATKSKSGSKPKPRS